MQVICSSEESLWRPEAVRWRQRMEMMEPLGDTPSSRRLSSLVAAVRRAI